MWWPAIKVPTKFKFTKPLKVQEKFCAMEVIVLKYVQLVCITFFMSGNVNCAQLMIDDKDMTNLKLSACVAECLDRQIANVSVNFDFASIWMAFTSLPSPEPQTVLRAMRQSIRSALRRAARRFQRIIRPVLSRLEAIINSGREWQRPRWKWKIHLFGYDSGDDESAFGSNRVHCEYLILSAPPCPIGRVRCWNFNCFNLKIKHRKLFARQSDVPLIELGNLTASESYNISAAVVSSKYKFNELGTQQHTTLNVNFVPDKVTGLTADEFYPIEGDAKRLQAVVEWTPVRRK